MNKDIASASLSIPELVNIITSVNLIIIFSILFFRRLNTGPNKILAFILLLPSLNFINNYLILSGNIFSFPSIIFISQIGAIAGIPLISHYIRMLTGTKWRLFIVPDLLSGILIVACLVYFGRFLLSDNQSRVLFAESIVNENGPAYLKYIRGGFFISLNACFLIITVQIVAYSRRVMEIRSEIDRYKVRYLQQFVILLWTLNVMVMLLYVFLANFFVDFIAVPLVITIFYIFIIRTAFNHTAVFTRKGYSEFRESLINIENINLSKAGIKDFSDDEAAGIRRKLEFFLDQKKIFTDCDLSIVKLAELLELSVHQTSFFINRYMKSNFFNLINSKRIDMAKEKMKMRGSKSEIEIIGFEVGFNSKSAFYRAFGKFVQQSPKDYIKTISE